jgi:predicted NAD-dependent protein-ADP-ribosyltransferase YbiA (DUF1768 family)
MISGACKVTILIDAKIGFRARLMRNPIEIRSKAPYPAGALSNFAAHAFVLDGVACACMEAFLQSLKVEDAAEQQRVCALPGPEAQGRGRRHEWRDSGTLWWRGVAVDRLSDAYQALLDRGYEALFAQAPRFRSALAATGDAQFSHAMGKDDPCETILTAEEFIGRLERLRARLS